MYPLHCSFCCADDVFLTRQLCKVCHPMCEVNTLYRVTEIDVIDEITFGIELERMSTRHLVLTSPPAQSISYRSFIERFNESALILQQYATISSHKKFSERFNSDIALGQFLLNSSQCVLVFSETKPTVA